LRRMNWRREVAKTAASDEPTVHWREPSDYPVVKFEQDRDAPRRSLKHRMNRRVSNGSSDGRVKANRDGLAAGSSAPDEPTVRRCNASGQLCQRIFNGVTWRASDEPTPRKSTASVHPTLPFSVTVSQRLFECLGLFISPPLTHLRLLDYVEVPRSSRHLEDHIQSIQVLNCSSIDLHMLSVCA
jgi:hypothetical protein